jgi:hypothetical protein
MVQTRSQTQASRDTTRARRTRMMTDASQAQSQSMKDASQLKVDQYITSCKPTSNQTQQISFTPSTPVKQNHQTITPTAPFKQSRYNTRSSTKSNSNLVNEEEAHEKEESMPQKHRYNTRLNSGSIQKTNLNMDFSNESDELSTSGNNLSLVFDAAFFDDASKAWNQNKTKLGNGMYAYRTRSSASKKY